MATQKAHSAEADEASIAQALANLNIRQGVCLMVHSSLSSFGYVEGGAPAVIAALLKTVGETGTLAMPAFCQKDKERRFHTWDPETSPSDTGRITETFRLWPGVLRSDHATHSVTAKGPLAAAITSGHRFAGQRPGPWGEAAFGHGGPYDKFLEFDAKVLLIGIDFRYNTIVHYIEHLIVERILRKLSPPRHAAAVSELRLWGQDGAWPLFDRIQLQSELEASGAVSRAVCAAATLLIAPVRSTVDQALALMEHDPPRWFEAAWLEWAARHSAN